MRSTLAALILTFLGSYLHAQGTDFPDPTAESPAIRERMDAVRGMENLSALRTQMQQLMKQNEMLLSQLTAMQEKTQQLEAELENVKRDQQLKDQQRRSVPEMKLVAQVRTRAGRKAEIKAGERMYRLTEGQTFRLQLTDGQVIPATPKFNDDGTIQIMLPDVNVEYLLAFRPTPPDPQASQARRNRQRELDRD